MMIKKTYQVTNYFEVYLVLFWRRKKVERILS